jgi:hypothetical protein
MAALDNVSAPQFYHGSRAKFSVGDMITTPDQHGGGTNWEGSSSKHTYMTPDKNAAAGFGRRLPRDAPFTPESDKGHLYHVEPTGPHSRDPDSPEGSGKMGWRRSKSPLKVTGIEY